MTSNIPSGFVFYNTPWSCEQLCGGTRYRHIQPPIGLQGVIGNIGSLQTPTFAVAQGSNVPIFRGGPPILTE